MGRFLKKWSWLLLVVFLVLLGAFARTTPGHQFSSFVFWGCALVVLAYRLLGWLKAKKPKLGKVLLWILSVCLCIGLVLASVTGVFIGVAGKGDADVPCDYVIVLGAGVNGTVPSLILSERINRAYTYLEANPGVICIVSGGQGPGEDITEAKCMYDRLVSKGIAPERIWQEDKSTSTRENLRFSMALIEERTGSRPTQAAIISNEFHLFRAGLFAKEQDLEMIGVPAKTTWFSLRANYFLREIVAVWYYLILGG